jgi:hypothetical protein
MLGSFRGLGRLPETRGKMIRLADYGGESIQKTPKESLSELFQSTYLK